MSVERMPKGFEGAETESAEAYDWTQLTEPNQFVNIGPGDPVLPTDHLNPDKNHQWGPSPDLQ